MRFMFKQSLKQRRSPDPAGNRLHSCGAKNVADGPRTFKSMPDTIAGRVSAGEMLPHRSRCECRCLPVIVVGTFFAARLMCRTDAYMAPIDELMLRSRRSRRIMTPSWFVIGCQGGGMMTFGRNDR